MLCDRRKDVDGKPISLRKIDGQEVHAGFHEVRHEGDVSSEPI
jgi:hypothetical protein